MIVGAGIAGSVLAIALRRAGRTVAIVEQSDKFCDRVRGDGLAPWGAALATSLGIEDVLRERARACELRYWDTWSPSGVRRDVLAERDPHGRGVMTFLHHHAQQALLNHAAELGVNVVRPAKVTWLARHAGVWGAAAGRSELRSPLVVVAGGRATAFRGVDDVEEIRDPTTHLVNGALLYDPDVDGLAVSTVRTATGRLLLFPFKRGLVRVYQMTAETSTSARTPHAIRAGILRDLEAARPGVMRRAKIVDRCASFPNASRWPSAIVGEGYARVGDAAGSTDPSIGQGLAIALRDVSELSGALAREDSIDAALNAYSEQRERYFRTQRLMGLVSWCLDSPTPEGARCRWQIEASNDRRRRDLLQQIRRDPASVEATAETAAVLLGGGDRDSSLGPLAAFMESVPYARSSAPVPS